jgi:hypothetical protein
VREIEQKLFTQTIEEAKYLEIDIGNADDLLLEANRLLFEQYITVENLLKENHQMQQQLVRDQIKRAAMESLKTICHTFNTYIHTASATILSRTQLLETGARSGEIQDKSGQLNVSLEVINNGVMTIQTAMDELTGLSNSDATMCDGSIVKGIEKRLQDQLAELHEVVTTN